MFAAVGGHASTVEILIMNVASLNAKTDLGWTAEFVAAKMGHTRTAEILRQAR